MAPVKGKQISDYELQHIKNVTENHRMWDTLRQNVVSQEKKFDSLQPAIIPKKKIKPTETREVKKPRLETEGQYEGSIVNDGIRKSSRISGKAKAQVRSNVVGDDDKDDEAVYDVEDSEEECDGEDSEDYYGDDSEAEYVGVNYEAEQEKMMFDVEEDEEDGEGRKRKRGRGLQNKIIKPKNRPNFYGAVPGVEIGRIWKTRLECSRDGVMRPHVHGIHGGPEGAYSIVLSGVYEDNMDHGDYLIYAGEGGRAKRNGAKRNGHPITDQTLTKGNLALNLNIETKKPVRVIRGYKAHTKFTPKFGYRYDGLYTVEQYWLCVGKGGFKVFKFALRRCPNQAPPPWVTNKRKKTNHPQHHLMNDSANQMTMFNQQQQLQTAAVLAFGQAKQQQQQKQLMDEDNEDEDEDDEDEDEDEDEEDEDDEDEDEDEEDEDDEGWSAGNSQHSLSGISASGSYGAMASAHETGNEAWTDLEEKLQRLQDEKRELPPPINARGHFAAYFLKTHGFGDTKSMIYNDIFEQYWNSLEEESIRSFVYLQTVSEKKYKKTQKNYDLKIVKTRRERDKLLFDKKYSAILQRISSSEVKNKSFQLDMDEVTIGRAEENCFVIDDVLISRKHAIFRLDNGKWTVESVGMNGIAVNNSIVTKNQQTPIYHTDVIDFVGDSKRYLYTFLLQSSSSDELPGDLNSNKSQSHKSDRQENKDVDDRKKSSHRDEERERSQSVNLEQSISPLPTLHPKTYLWKRPEEKALGGNWRAAIEDMRGSPLTRRHEINLAMLRVLEEELQRLTEVRARLSNQTDKDHERQLMIRRELEKYAAHRDLMKRFDNRRRPCSAAASLIGAASSGTCKDYEAEYEVDSDEKVYEGEKNNFSVSSYKDSYTESFSLHLSEEEIDSDSEKAIVHSGERIIYLSNANIEETKGDVESDFTMASDELTRSETCLRDQHPKRSPQLNIAIKTLPKEDEGNCIEVSIWEEIQARLKKNNYQPPNAKRLRTDQPLPSSPESIQSDLTHPAHDLPYTPTPIDVHFAVEENASNEMISPNCSRRSMAWKRPQQRYDDADMNKKTLIENRMFFFFVIGFFLCFILFSIIIKLAIH